MIVAVVGLGLIGGSAALDLKARGFTHKVIGIDTNPKHTSLALRRGIVDEVLDLSTAIQKANLVIVAIPVDAMLQVLPSIMDMADPHTVVTDMGSTKTSIIQAIQNHPNRSNFVAAHPMAGTEFSGPTAAVYKLFDGKAAIICNAYESDPEAVEIVESMYRILNMPLLYMDAHEHDVHAAYVSHIAHITSFALANTVLEKEKSTNNIFNLASGGFASTVRLAKSSPTMWQPIFQQNASNVVEVLDTYIKYMQTWRNNIKNQNFEAINQLMQNANEIKKIL